VTASDTRSAHVRRLRQRLVTYGEGRLGTGLAEGVGLVTRQVELEQLAPRWDSLADRAGPVLSSAWIQSWADVYGRQHRLRILTVDGGTGTRAVLPLVRSRQRPWRLELLGVDQLREYSDVLSSDEEALLRLAQAVVKWRVPLRLARIPSNSPLLPALRRAFPGPASLHVRQAAGTPFIALDTSWEEPEGSFNARRRADFRAARRRAQRLGQLTTEMLSPSPDQVDSLFDELVTVEAAGWKSAAGTALRTQPDMRSFYLLYCRRAATAGILRLAFLRIAGRAVAVQLAVEQASRYWLLKIGYDEKFSRCSPGTLLMLYTVAWATARGLESYEFLGQEEAWTAVWTQQVRSYVAVHTRPPSLWTAASAAEELARHVVRTRLHGAPHQRWPTPAAESVRPSRPLGREPGSSPR
jgi:CelD/BcsL family acetyltransferase involved in cellulose biosynthesis